MPVRKITWTKSAILQLSKSIEYIKDDSPQNAEKVKHTILEKIEELKNTMIQHRADQYRKNNDGNFLYIEILQHRISYYNTDEEVVIVRIRHTKMNPQKY